MRTVSKIFLAIGISIMLLSVVSCHKDPEEKALRISTDASSVNTTPSPDFNFNLKVESKMPSAGVSIDYIVKGETDNHVYFQSQATTSNSQARLTIINLPRQITCICTIVVTSKTKATNTATTSFRVGYK
jgi:hypothetical protein